MRGVLHVQSGSAGDTHTSKVLQCTYGTTVRRSRCGFQFRKSNQDHFRSEKSDVCNTLINANASTTNTTPNSETNNRAYKTYPRSTQQQVPLSDINHQHESISKPNTAKETLQEHPRKNSCPAILGLLPRQRHERAIHQPTRR